MAKITGIDVSEWQKSIDWAAVKPQIDFVILREGYRKAADKYFFQNVEGCKNNQIPIHGVYHFLYALNNQDVTQKPKAVWPTLKRLGCLKLSTFGRILNMILSLMPPKKESHLVPMSAICLPRRFATSLKSEAITRYLYQWRLL